MIYYNDLVISIISQYVDKYNYYNFCLVCNKFYLIANKYNKLNMGKVVFQLNNGINIIKTMSEQLRGYFISGEKNYVKNNGRITIPPIVFGERASPAIFHISNNIDSVCIAITSKLFQSFNCYDAINVILTLENNLKLELVFDNSQYYFISIYYIYNSDQKELKQLYRDLKDYLLEQKIADQFGLLCRIHT